MSDYRGDGYEGGGSLKQAEKKNKITSFLGVIGFVAAVVFLGIAFVLSGPVTDMLSNSIAGFPTNTIDFGTSSIPVMQVFVIVVLFMLFMLVSWMVYAFFTPKPEKEVSENVLAKEREATRREQLAMKKRKQLMNKQRADMNRQRSRER